MPPKARNTGGAVRKQPSRVAKEEKYVRPKTPDECHDPVPFPKNEEALNALLPYLALGFVPDWTGGVGTRTCGINALFGSYKAAIEELQIPDRPLQKDLKLKDFKACFSSPEFQAIIDRELAKPVFQDMLADSPEEYYEHKAVFDAKNNLDVNKIQWLLEVVNSRYGTDFQLGYITQGYRGKICMKTNVWDTKFLKPTGTQLDSTNRPVIWIWNDNFEDRGENHRLNHGGKKNGECIGHWECLTAKPNPGREEHSRRQRVQEWQLGQLMLDDLAHGVWRVTQHCEGVGENEVPVRAGHFVRDAPLPARLPSRQGWRYMKTCNGQFRGFVPEEALQHIVLHPKAPTPWVEENRIAPKRKSSVVGSKAASEGEVDAHSSILKPFRILRVIPSVGKTGGNITKTLTLNSLEINNGDFLLTHSQTPERITHATNIAGQSGSVSFHRLQLPIDNPWGLPNELPVLPDLSISSLSTAAELRAAANACGLHTQGDEPALLKSILDWERKRTRVIPLLQLTRAYSAEDTGTPQEFSQGEIVRYWHGSEGKTGDAVTVDIMDYEGYQGTVLAADLRAIGQKTDDGPAPFGIRLDLTKLPPDMGGGAEHGRDRSREPVAKSTSGADTVVGPCGTQPECTGSGKQAITPREVDSDVDTGRPGKEKTSRKRLHEDVNSEAVEDATKRAKIPPKTTTEDNAD